MMIKASGRSALILATGAWVCFAGPSQAATSADSTATTSRSAASSKYARHNSHHLKKVAHRRSSRLALGSSAVGKDADVADAGGDSSSTLPPSVANANAQLASAEVPACAGYPEAIPGSIEAGVRGDDNSRRTEISRLAARVDG